MLKSDAVNIVLLDHNYCHVKESEVSEEFFEDFLSFLPYKMDVDMDFSFGSDFPESSCSPAYSSDSGVDSVYADLTSDLSSYDFNLASDLTSHSKWIESMPEEEPPAPRGRQTMQNEENEKMPVAFKVPSGKLHPGKCFTEEDMLEKNRKNAEAARENRQKKKKYLEGLEKEVKELKENYGKVTLENSGLKNTVSALQEEVTYLRNVIANQGTLSLLLKNISSTPGISLSTSFSPLKPNNETVSKAENTQNIESRRTSLRKRKMESSENNNSSAKRKNNADKEHKGSGGICLHVCQERVSLEFCAKCSQNAEASWK